MKKIVQRIFTLLTGLLLLSACVKEPVGSFPVAVTPSEPTVAGIDIPTGEVVLLTPFNGPSQPTQQTHMNTPYISYMQTRTSQVDGMTLMFVEEGDFLMGSVKGEGEADEQPQHKVFLDAYWIDQTEVTNRMYSLCVEAGSCKLPASLGSYTRDDYFGNPEYLDFPVIFVDWFRADKYCKWAERRLPTEAEWEKGARGTEGMAFPWGNEVPDNLIANFDLIIGDTTRAGFFPNGISPFGVLDMAGNVSEWVADYYAEYPSANYESSNPAGPDTGSHRITRGGSWIFSEFLIRSGERYWVNPYYTGDDTGFRCAYSEE